MPPILIEKYLAAAEKIIDAATRMRTSHVGALVVVENRNGDLNELVTHLFGRLGFGSLKI